MWAAPGTRKVMNFDAACCGAHSANTIEALAKYPDVLAISVYLLIMLAMII